MKTLIKNGKIIKKENQLIEAALWLENGVIHAIGESFDEADFEQVFDANGQLITPGLVDVHVHFREPGFTYKENPSGIWCSPNRIPAANMAPT